ncbi:MAG: hypothetical protein A2252_04745 [Elusimicrobia bacterium RIFOXYA2_FULL_39_19]|nr:MAG: hypothetical protein A2252_04745 [Elusimicrobia bacterium RIFOXYA2_FULL_39_19]
MVYSTRMRINKKSSFLLFSFLFIGFVLSLYFFSSLISKYLINQQIEYFIGLTKTLAKNTSNAIAISDNYALRMYVNDVMQARNSKYCIIADDKGKVLQSSFQDKKNEFLISILVKESLLSNSVDIKEIAFFDEKVLDIVFPLIYVGSKWGCIKVGFSLQEVKKKSILVNTIIFSAGLVLFLSFSVFFLFFPGIIKISTLKISGLKTDGEEHRRFVRVFVDIKTDIIFNEENKYLGNIIDISVSGARVICQEKIEQNARIKLKFKLRNNDYLALPGIIAWGMFKDDSSLYGINFEKLNMVEKIELASFIERIKIKQEQILRKQMKEDIL